MFCHSRAGNHDQHLTLAPLQQSSASSPSAKVATWVAIVQKRLARTVFPRQQVHSSPKTEPTTISGLQRQTSTRTNTMVLAVRFRTVAFILTLNAQAKESAIVSLVYARALMVTLAWDAAALYAPMIAPATASAVATSMQTPTTR